jgi:hypothetical protein
MSGPNESMGSTPRPAAPAKKPWPLSWVLIAILLYIAFQVAFLLFND